jgi:hypothetical protein
MAELKCGKCGDNLDTTGYPLWCKSCRAKYKREYEETKSGMVEHSAYLRGADAMRAKLLEEISKQHPMGQVTVGSVAAWIAETKRPEFVSSTR